MVAVPLEFEPSTRGGLCIWRRPEPLRKYVIGVDTAGGLAKGDFAVAVVIEGRTCDVVATWRERDDPNVWGPKCAYLGWYFNEAMLAIETYPSAHGMTACREAHHTGYTNLYRRSPQNMLGRPMREQLGWSTDTTSKPQLINRVKAAIRDAAENGVTPVLCPDLLDELHQQHWNDKGEMESGGHDDMVIAYGIALMVRDQCWREGKLREEKPQPNTESERYWAWREKMDARTKQKPKHRLRIA